MAIKLEIKTNQKQFSKKFKKFESVLPRIIDKGVKQAGFQLVDIIRTKTKKGIDFNDRRFAPYSEGYLKQLYLYIHLFYIQATTQSLTV